MNNDNNSSKKNQNTYVLFIPLSSNKEIEINSVDWRKLSQQFDLNLIRERKSQATVEANSEQIKKFQESYPKIEVTIKQRYKLSFA